MSAAQDIAIIGTLLGDKTRAAIVAALLNGRAFTARELAHGAGVTPQTASFHVSKLDGKRHSPCNMNMAGLGQPNGGLSLK